LNIVVFVHDDNRDDDIVQMLSWDAVVVVVVAGFFVQCWGLCMGQRVVSREIVMTIHSLVLCNHPSFDGIHFERYSNSSKLDERVHLKWMGTVPCFYHLIVVNP
jgi:folate-dependent phosphoribosylglycinamide formyltransferase PurN